MYKIYEPNLPRLRKKMATIKKKCIRYGCDFSYEEGETSIVEKEVKNEDGSVTKLYLPFVEVTVTGRAIIADWEYVASLEATSKGNIIAKNPTADDVPSRFYDCTPCCEHCNTNRYRKNYYIVRNVNTNEYKLVGKNCLADYTHGLDPQFITAWMNGIDELVGGESWYGTGGFHHVRYYDTKEILTYAAEAVLKIGYRKAYDEDGDINPDSTKRVVLDFYKVHNNEYKVGHSREDLETYYRIVNRMESIGFNPKNPKAIELANNALDWIRSQTKTSNFMNNLVVTCSMDFVTENKFGLLFCILPMYDKSIKQLEAKKKKELSEKNSQFVGEVGKRIKVKLVSADIVSSWANQFGYTYLVKMIDENGNILSENDGNQTISYTYDGKNQLIATTKGERTDQYQYDQAGNLTYTVRRDWLGMIGVHNYYYENDSWGDLLTKYDYGPIAYEGQTFNSSNQSVTGTPVSGNPISYYNGSNRRYTMSWTNGSQLSSVQFSGKNIEYQYDCDGIRKAKTVNGVTWNYITQSGKLVRAKSNDVVLDFIYDNLNEPYAVNYSTDNGSTWETFYYVRNLQGDIIKILNASGEVVARYKYDSWGLSLGIDDGTGESIAEDSIGKLNPLRYRGYIYDAETGFYYLNSRYYDPEIGRFVNSDIDDSIIGDVASFFQYGLFTYCWNNPIRMLDEEGNIPNSVKIAVGAVATTTAIAITIATGGTVLPILASVASFTVGGAIEGYCKNGKQGAIDGAANGFMIGGLTAVANSIVGAAKTVRTYKKSIDAYNNLKKQSKGTGLEVHHILEKRFVRNSRWKPSKMPSIKLNKAVHRIYTNAWRKEIAYGTHYSRSLAFKMKLYFAANRVYKESRVLRMAARYTILKM